MPGLTLNPAGPLCPHPKWLNVTAPGGRWPSESTGWRAALRSLGEFQKEPLLPVLTAKQQPGAGSEQEDSICCGRLRLWLACT